MSDYTEHLISMAGGDGDQLAAIEAIIQPYASTVEERRGVHPDSVFTAAVDLLAMVREQRAKLEALEAEPAILAAAKAIHAQSDWEDWSAGDWRAQCAINEARAAIRAALTATEGA
jgi:hypothetical protein